MTPGRNRPTSGMPNRPGSTSSGRTYRGKPEGDRFPREAELRTHHADHRALLPPDVVGAPDHGGVAAEPGHPEVVAEECDPVLVFGKRQAAEVGRHPQYREQGRGGEGHPHPLGAVADPQGVGEVGVRRDPLEQLRLFLVLKEEFQRQLELVRQVRPGRGAGDVHQPFRLGERQRPEQHRIHDAEDPRVHSKREPQRSDRDDGKPRRAPQGAYRLAQVLDPSVSQPAHDFSSPAPRGCSEPRSPVLRERGADQVGDLRPRTAYGSGRETVAGGSSATGSRPSRPGGASRHSVEGAAGQGEQDAVLGDAHG